ncbi:MAG: hydrolase [Deltaproteobacteria bacterium]|nr:hydrolase [Deltaproteobacteria bacterium]
MRPPHRRGSTLLCLVTLALLACPALSEATPSTTVFVARKIVTMEPAMPEAKVVAVREGLVLGVGTRIEDLAPWLATGPVEIDRRFEEHVLMPGLIDPHLHPMMAAVLLPTHFITPEDWTLPRGEFPGIRTPEAYRKKLRATIASAPDDDRPVITWGYMDLWHGPLDRAALDAIEAKRPVIVWQRSFHELIFNTPAMELLGIGTRDRFEQVMDEPGVDPTHWSYEAGHVNETALKATLPLLAPIILAPDHLAQGFASLQRMMLTSGVTMIADMATGLFDSFENEAKTIRQSFEAARAPARILLVPTAVGLVNEHGSVDAAITALRRAMPRLASDQILIDDRIKLLADGAFFSQYMRMNPPGYTDGHEGKWLLPPDQLEELARAFWRADFTIHCHVNGDEGLDVVLDVLEELERETPRPDHRFTLEHFGYSTEAQNRRVAKLGALVSAQPNYLYMLGRKYAEHGLGHDRASQISRLGSLEAKGTTIALHSDSTMAPIDPLFLAWIAATRHSMEGGVLAPGERLSLDKALRAITIDAAYVLGLESEIGSIAAGKRADFAVLEQDPYEVGAEGLRDIPIWGVVFEGRAVRARVRPDAP